MAPAVGAVVMSQFDQIRTLDDVGEFINEGYRSINRPADPLGLLSPSREFRFGFPPGRLPLAVAEPGPLIEHAVGLAGDRG